MILSIFLFVISTLFTSIFALQQSLLDANVKINDHSSRWLFRIFIISICYIVQTCINFGYIRDLGYGDIPINVIVLALFFILSQMVLFSLIFDSFKNFIEEKQTSYIGNTAFFDKLARVFFKDLFQYNIFKIVCIIIFTFMYFAYLYNDVI